MAKTINKVELLGRVGADPEMKYTQGGTAVAQLRLATDRVRKNGENATDWHTVVVWDRLAEAVNQYSARGSASTWRAGWCRTRGRGTTGSDATAPRFTLRRWCSWTPRATATARPPATTTCPSSRSAT